MRGDNDKLAFCYLRIVQSSKFSVSARCNSANYEVSINSVLAWWLPLFRSELRIRDVWNKHATYWVAKIASDANNGYRISQIRVKANFRTEISRLKIVKLLIKLIVTGKKMILRFNNYSYILFCMHVLLKNRIFYFLKYRIEK